MDWRNIPSLSALRAFEAAARCKSFSKAARELNVTHAAIAQHVRALEAEFSESLMRRQGRGIVTTPAGQALAEQLRAGFSVIAEGIQELRNHGAERPLNIAVTPAFATSWLMPRIGEFWAHHPDIALNINPSTKLVDLQSDGFDLAIRFGRGDWPGVACELLTEGNFLVVAHPKLIKGRSVTNLADVTDLPWISEPFFGEHKALLNRAGISPESLNLTPFNTTSLVHAAAREGLGIAILSSTLVEQDIATGALVNLLELRSENLGYYLIPVSPTPAPKLRPFMTWLHKKAAEARSEAS